MLFSFIEAMVGIIGLVNYGKGVSFLIICIIIHRYVTEIILSRRRPSDFPVASEQPTGLRSWGVRWYYLEAVWIVSGDAYGGLGDLLLARPSLWAGVFLLTCVLTLLLFFNVYALSRFMYPCRDGVKLFRKALWADALVWPVLTVAFKALLCSDVAGFGHFLDAVFSTSTNILRGFHWEGAPLAVVWATIWLLYLETEKIKQLEALLEGETRISVADTKAL